MNPLIAEVVFWAAAVACGIAELAILRMVFAPHGNAQSPATVPQSPRGTEMLWAVIPAIGVAVLLAATWRAIH